MRSMSHGKGWRAARVTATQVVVTAPAGSGTQVTVTGTATTAYPYVAAPGN